MFFHSTTPAGGQEDKVVEKESGEKEETSTTAPPEGGTVLDTPVAALTLEQDAGSGCGGGSGGDESDWVDENSVKRLTDMGFMADMSRATLRKHNGNETAAINELLSSV
jgi:hypothetical protein